MTVATVLSRCCYDCAPAEEIERERERERERDGGRGKDSDVAKDS